MEVGGTHENPQYPIWTGELRNFKKKKVPKIFANNTTNDLGFSQNSTEY